MKTHSILGALVVSTPFVLSAPIDDPAPAAAAPTDNDPSSTADFSSFSAADTIQRDVVILGGGSSGTHAAIRLKDLGKKVVVIEKDVELGGHVKTYTVASGTRVNYGPGVFQNFPVVQNFFARFNIPLTTVQRTGTGDVFADFSTGQPVPAGTIPPPDFSAYFAQLSKYPDLEKNWDLPKPVPEDLLLPFGSFVEKYNLQNIAFLLAQFAIGNGNIFEKETVYVLKSVYAGYLQATVLGQGVTPANYDSHQIFEKALAELGSDALLSSTVTSAKRSNTGVELTVKTPKGVKLIKAKKLLVTAPPLLSNMQPLGLDANEKSLFSKFSGNSLYVELVNNTGLQPGIQYYNAVPQTTYNVPKLPALQLLWATKDVDTYWGWYSAPGAGVSESRVKSDTVEAIRKLAPGSNPNFVAYHDDSPMGVGVPASEIRNGFYDKLAKLQGSKSTWYTGSAWVSDHSAVLWNHTEAVLLPQLTA